MRRLSPYRGRRQLIGRSPSKHADWFPEPAFAAHSFFMTITANGVGVGPWASAYPAAEVRHAPRRIKWRSEARQPGAPSEVPFLRPGEVR